MIRRLPVLPTILVAAAAAVMIGLGFASVNVSASPATKDGRETRAKSLLFDTAKGQWFRRT